MRNHPKEDFIAPHLCPSCLGLTEEERRSARRKALAEEKRRDTRHKLRKEIRSEAGRLRLRDTSRSRFIEAAQAMYSAPDPANVHDRIKDIALDRVDRIGGEASSRELKLALTARGTDAGRIARMLSNPAITDEQCRKVTRALALLAGGGEYPKGIADQLKVGGALGMTTGLAGTASRDPRIARAAAYEIFAAASIANNPEFPFPFGKSQIASFHYRFQHNRYGSESTKKSYEGDIVIQQSSLLGDLTTTFVDFKHSMTGNPSITPDELERIFHGLARGEIDQAVIVSNGPLSSRGALELYNQRIAALNQERGDDHIPEIKTFIQRW